MKKDSNLSSTLTFNNEFRWAYVLRTFGLVFTHILFLSIWVFIIEVLFHWLADLPLMENVTREVILIGTTAVLMLVVEVLRYFRRFRTGEYSIVGNNLIVHEQYFSNTTNLMIPISRITDVRYTSCFLDLANIWKDGFSILYYPFRLLEINVGEQKYQLYAYAYAEELHAELSKRIGNNSNNL